MIEPYPFEMAENQNSDQNIFIVSCKIRTGFYKFAACY
jgi:hypothetical protein